jgi:hypothetical protein
MKAGLGGPVLSLLHEGVSGHIAQNTAELFLLRRVASFPSTRPVACHVAYAGRLSISPMIVIVMQARPLRPVNSIIQGKSVCR